MRLSKLLYAIGEKFNGKDEEITLITDDSRKCAPGCVFVCHENAVPYVSKALENGALWVVANEKLCENASVVSETRKAYAVLCREFFSCPDKKLKMIAVTGTNGKTSVSMMLCHIFEMNARKTGLIGTVLNKAEEPEPSSMTTPDCFALYSLLDKMVKNGCEFCVVEASSQGLAQQRLYGIEFEAGIFTNLQQDHLDYHKTAENYKNAKLSLFESCKSAIINYDDEHKDEFIAACKGRVVTYSQKSDEADFTARGVRYFSDSTSYELVSHCLIHRIVLSLGGDFWVPNSLAAAVCAYESGLSIEQCAYALRSFSGVKGRMEVLSCGTDFRIVIDYAHTADGLRNVLTSLRRFCKGRLILVFGCGGDREHEKRSEMGKIAVTYADAVFVTSDNPRTEDAQSIIDDILLGVKKGRTSVYIQKDRKKAIEAALRFAKKGDTVLLAGKGHEEYQLVGDEKIPFDERKIVCEILGI